VKKPSRKATSAKRAPAATSRRAAKAKAKPAAKAKAKTKVKTKAKAAARKPKPKPRSWPKFVEKHGVVLASARGPVPSLAEAIAGEPIVGSWWSHPRAQTIFDALSTVDDDLDVRCFRLVDGKVTFVHRRLWPALVRLARDGVLSAERVASLQQEHMPTGEHRNLVTPFPDWVPDEVAAAADQLTADQARTELGAWT
jgi:hypothetical protein